MSYAEAWRENRRLLKEIMNLVSFLGGLLWVFGTLTMGLKLKGLGGNAFARHCQHCRLHKGELEPPDEHQPR